MFLGTLRGARDRLVLGEAASKEACELLRQAEEVDSSEDQTHPPVSEEDVQFKWQGFTNPESTLEVPKEVK